MSARLTCGLGAGGVGDGVHLQPVLGGLPQGRSRLPGGEGRSHEQGRRRRLVLVVAGGGGRGGRGGRGGGGGAQFIPSSQALQAQRLFQAVHRGAQRWGQPDPRGAPPRGTCEAGGEASSVGERALLASPGRPAAASPETGSGRSGLSPALPAPDGAPGMSLGSGWDDRRQPPP